MKRPYYLAEAHFASCPALNAASLAQTGAGPTNEKQLAAVYGQIHKHGVTKKIEADKLLGRTGIMRSRRGAGVGAGPS